MDEISCNPENCFPGKCLEVFVESHLYGDEMVFDRSTCLCISDKFEGLTSHCDNFGICGISELLETGDELSVFLNDGMEDDRSKFFPFPVIDGLVDELQDVLLQVLSMANLLATGIPSPVVAEFVLFFGWLKEQLLYSCSVEVLLLSHPLSLVLMLLIDSNGRLR